MKPTLAARQSRHQRMSMHLAIWLLDTPPLAQTAPIKRFAVQLLKPAAKQGVVAAQSRLGCLLCHEAADLRDRRVGQEMLRLAARAGDHGAREALECLTAQLRLPSLRSSRQG